MKKKYISPDMELKVFELSSDILEKSYEGGAVIGGDVLPTEFTDIDL